MKIRIEIDGSIEEEEVVIRCSELTDEIASLQKMLSGAVSRDRKLEFYQGDKVFYLPISSILFFETADTGVQAHTADDTYNVHYKLYELEEMLPGYFTRISKSSILNIRKIYSITRNISSSSEVEFQGSYKKVYVSRYYYKLLKDILELQGK